MALTNVAFQGCVYQVGSLMARLGQKPEESICWICSNRQLMIRLAAHATMFCQIMRWACFSFTRLVHSIIRLLCVIRCISSSACLQHSYDCTAVPHNPNSSLPVDTLQHDASCTLCVLTTAISCAPGQCADSARRG